jgi:GntR family transcriptional regulator
VPCTFCPGMTKENIEKNGLYFTMRSMFNLHLDAMEETIEAIIISSENAHLLNTSHNSAGLYLRRTTYAQEQIVEYTETIVNGDLYKYQVYLQTTD